MIDWERRPVDIWLRSNDTAPAITSTLRDGTGTVVNLTGSTVKFQMYAPGAASAKVNASATIVSPTGGTVSYTPTGPNTDTPGEYMACWQVTFGGGAVETFPNLSWLKVRVSTDLAA